MNPIFLFIFITLFSGTTVASYNDGLVARYEVNLNAPSNIAHGSFDDVCEVFGASKKKDNEHTYFYFDGVDDYLDCGNNQKLNIKDEITISAWIKPENLRASTIITKESVSNEIRNYNVEIHSPKGEIKFSYKNTDEPYANIISKSGVIIPNEWVYFVVTTKKNHLNFYLFYKNGFYVETKPLKSQPFSTDPNAHMLIGKSVWPGFEFKGGIDNLAIHNRALSIGEIHQMYQDEQSKSVWTVRRRSFADDVISFNDNFDSSETQGPGVALGAPGSGINRGVNNVSISSGGEIVLQFIDNSLTTSGNSDFDLLIFGYGGNATVSISKNGGEWINVGSFSARTSDEGEEFANDYGIDIDAFVESGVNLNEQYYYVKLSASDSFSFDAIGTNPETNISEIPDILTETISTGTVSPNLDIHIPSLIHEMYDPPGIKENIWADFEFFDETLQGEMLWKLKDYGKN